MPIPPSQTETVAFLTQLAGAPPIETHISLVFLGPRTAWKLRKAVRLSFLDFSAIDTRRRFALRELALNRPGAPGLYRDVLPVIRRADGRLALGSGRDDPARACDWVVRMARVPTADFLDHRAATGRLAPSLLADIGDAVAAYHAQCPIIRAGDPAAAMAAIVAGNVLAAREAGLDATTVAGWERGVTDALAPLAPWLAARARGGFVRRAHGDLHLGNLCLWRRLVVPFDALEFDEALATIDLGYDLAFLLMDLERRAGRSAANAVMNRYIARTGDVGLLAGLVPFLSLRAMIRAHVAARSADPAAAWYLAAAIAYLTPASAALVAVGGVPGSGKSTLARALAPQLGRAPGAVVLRSDEIRKRQAGVAPEVKLPPAAYSKAASRAVFRTLARDARQALAAGQAVLADATFLGPAERRAIRRAAGRSRFAGLWLAVPLAVAAARIRGRRRDASDATVAVLISAAARARRPRGWIGLAAGAEVVAAAVARLGEAGISVPVAAPELGK